MRLFRLRILTLALAITSWTLADPPKDPKARQIYDHDLGWLSHFPNAFIVTNIRGEGLQYAERRQAALDLIREKRDATAVPELVNELEIGSFLSGEICDVLGEWKSREAISMLETVVKDKKRSKDVRRKAQQALVAIRGKP